MINVGIVYFIDGEQYSKRPTYLVSINQEYIVFPWKEEGDLFIMAWPLQYDYDIYEYNGY